MNSNRGDLSTVGAGARRESRWVALIVLVALAAVSLPSAAGAQEKKATGKGATESTQAPVSMCIGCHSIPGYHASFPQVFRVPKIGGQSKEYIEAALRAYQKGERNQPTMKAVARELTDQQIVALAAYYAERGEKSGKQ